MRIKLEGITLSGNSGKEIMQEMEWGRCCGGGGLRGEVVSLTQFSYQGFLSLVSGFAALYRKETYLPK